MAKVKKGVHSAVDIRAFFARSDYLDRMALRPMGHIAPNWDMRWNEDLGLYDPEPQSFAEDLNQVITLIADSPRPVKYHDNEDVLAENVLRDLKWPIQKRSGRWEGEDYAFILEQGAFSDLNQSNLIAAASGRVHAAMDFGQRHFDSMEDGHLNMLSGILTIAIYHRYCAGTSCLIEEDAK